MARKGQFKKGGGRVGGGSSPRGSRSRKSSSGTTTAIVVAAPRAMTAPRRKRRASTGSRAVVRTQRRRRSRRSVSMNPLHLALATAGLAYLTGPSTPVPQISTTIAKVPGVKTFGAPAVVGLGALAVDRFVRPNKWLKLMGVAGVVLAASRIGEKGKDFTWVGDDDDVADFDDVAGDYDDDVGDDYDGEE